MAEAFPTIVHLLGSRLAIIHLLGLRVARLALCIRGTLGKDTVRMYPSFRVPTATNINIDCAVIKRLAENLCRKK